MLTCALCMEGSVAAAQRGEMNFSVLEHVIQFKMLAEHKTIDNGKQ